MKKYKIFYIDDQSFALPQLIHAIPIHIEYELIYIQRVQDIVMDFYDIVLLDFYLDKNGLTAQDIISKFLWMTIISFSTSQQKNNMMLKNGAIYGIQKLKNTHTNYELTQTLKNIFSVN